MALDTTEHFIAISEPSEEAGGVRGLPKGVTITHRNATNFFAGIDGTVGPEPGVMLSVTSISFDISVLELWWSLTRGFTVLLHDQDKEQW